jgi:hypothetical protein
MTRKRIIYYKEEVIMRIETITGSTSFIPSSYDSTNSVFKNLPDNTANALKSTTATSSSFATFKGANATEQVGFYNFTVTGLSESYTITSVSSKIRAYLNGDNVRYHWVAQISKGTTVTGNSVIITSRTVQTYEFNCGNGWTVADFSNVKLRISPYGEKSQNGRLYLYGSDLLINYSYDKTWYSISAASSVAGVSITSSAAEVELGNSVTLTTNASSLTGITIKDNGVDATSNFTGTSGNYRYTLTNVNADHSFTVTEKSSQGSGVFTKEGGVWNEAPAVYKMINSAWVKQTDAQNIFTDSVYLKTDGTLFIRKNL